MQEAVADLCRVFLFIQIFIALAQRMDEAGLQRRPQFLLHLIRGFVTDHGQRFQLEAIADGGGQLQQLLGFYRQAADFFQHQVDHVVGVVGALQRSHVPAPAIMLEVITQVAGFVDCLQELIDKEGIAMCFLVTQAGQRSAVGSRDPQSIGIQLRHVLLGQWRQR